MKIEIETEQILAWAAPKGSPLTDLLKGGPLNGSLKGTPLRGSNKGFPIKDLFSRVPTLRVSLKTAPFL